MGVGLLKRHFAMMAAYNRWANEQLYGAASRLPDMLYRRDVGAFFGSLHGTLNHLLVTDRIWLTRFTHTGTPPESLDAILFEDFDELRAAREQEDKAIIDFVDSLRASALDEPFGYRNSHGIMYSQRRADALSHVFNHQTHHRGQAHCIMSILGAFEPPPLDLLAYQRIVDSQAP